MDRKQALARLREITRGIDLYEGESDDGWWETTTGADFGERKLQELEQLIEQLAPDGT